MTGARSVLKWSVRRANCKRFTTNGRLTEPVQGQSTAVWSGALNGRRRQMLHVQRSSLSSLFVKLRVFLGEAQNKTPHQHKTPNCQPLRSFSPVKPVVNRLLHQQIHAKVKRTGSLIRPGICAFCLTAGRNPAQVRLAILLAFHGAVQIISRSSPTHDLERRLVRFLRLHRATLC